MSSGEAQVRDTDADVARIKEEERKRREEEERRRKAAEAERKRREAEERRRKAAEAERLRRLNSRCPSGSHGVGDYCYIVNRPWG